MGDLMKKKKLLLPIVGLLLAALTVGTSYAWFSTNMTLGTESLDVNIGAANGIDISTNAVDWNTAITKSDLLTASYIGNQNQIPTVITPSSSPITVTNGLLDIWDGLVVAPESWFNLQSTKAVDPSASLSTNAAASSGSYFVFDIFIKASSDKTISLINTSNVEADGVDRGLKNTARIAIINEGTAATPSNAYALSEATNDDVWLWEPNVNVHNLLGQSNANSTYLARTGGGIGGSTIVPSYDAVKADILVEDSIGLGETTLSKPDKFTLLTPGDIDLQTKESIAGEFDIASGTPIITTISSGITKLRIYVWIEGQDVDCENGSSGSDISFNIQLTAEGKTKTTMRGPGYDGLGSTADLFWDVKESITSITFQDEINIPGGVTSWDVSEELDGSIMAYIVDDGLGASTNKLYIQSDDLIYAPSNMSNFFLDFHVLTAINNFHLLNTSDVTSMTWVFSDCNNLVSLDLSSFNTSGVTNMTAMFVDCNSLISLNLRSFDTHNVISMASMFQMCSSLTELNLSTFDTANVTEMNWMFHTCSGLTTISIGHFVTSIVTKVYAMFYNCSSLTSLDLKSAVFNTISSPNYDYMFAGITSGIDIRVKDATAKAWIEARLVDAYRTGNVHT